MEGKVRVEGNPFGDLVFRTEREHLPAALRALRDDHGFDMLLDTTVVDRLELPDREPRFDLVYNMRPSLGGLRVRVQARIPAEDPVAESASGIWRAAEWGEREVFDQYGVRFRGHPNCKRILNHKDFVGHPLRRDYDIKKQQWLSEPDDLLDEMEKKRAADPEPGERESMLINLGPSHPAMHGALRVLLDLDGETIRHAVPEIGYLHRGFEKSAEKGNYTQVIPYTDRLNYCSSVMNNVGYCRTVEKMLGVEITPRGAAIRVILLELGRIMDHCVQLAANLVDLGALTNYWYLFNEREKIYNVIEALCGARLTHCYFRIGGSSHDLHEGFAEGVREVLRSVPRALADVEKMVARNRIFLDRTVGVGAISAADAISHGFTGPCLRAAGVQNDLRKDEPYYGYETYDWDVVVGEKGDTYDRIWVRFEEVRQSLRIVEQALTRLPGGPANIDDPRVVLPPKREVYENIEALMNHFMLTMYGIRPPAGECYGAIEAANGELGFFTVSDGTGRPYKVKVRPPCFYVFSAFERLVEGGMIQDAIAVLGSLNIIAGELDR
ncbi:MAG: NADH dehydrogenase (quinone) subunit D [Candidatus Eisenbacteria bacterium]|nr:NADH dehydrogenase (quinone) subunit D [Candidatus Eisenbacteria bacterium]